tara:strand:+ start:17757 stop:18380 length:624 start_codon:yes stop_codon:yes gene_type:complete
MLHTFGDSHGSKENWESLVEYGLAKTNKLGPRLMYSVGRDKLKILDISDPEYNIKDGDLVLFSFGEVDCRNHIAKHVNMERPYKKIIENLVKNYLDVIAMNIKKLSDKKINLRKVFIYNIIPCSKAKDIKYHSKTYPFVGTDEERRTYHNYMNKMLKEHCEEYGYIFVDIYEHYLDNETGYLNRKLANDIHLKKTQYFENKIKNLIK